MLDTEQNDTTTGDTTGDTAGDTPGDTVPAKKSAARKTTRKTAAKKTAAPLPEVEAADVAAPTAEVPAKKATRSRRATRPAAPPDEVPAAAAPAEPAAPAESTEPAAKTTRSRTRKTAAPAPDQLPIEAPAEPVRRTRSRKATAAPEAETQVGTQAQAQPEPAPEPAATEPARAPRRSTRKASAPTFTAPPEELRATRDGGGAPAAPGLPTFAADASEPEPRRTRTRRSAPAVTFQAPEAASPATVSAAADAADDPADAPPARATRSRRSASRPAGSASPPTAPVESDPDDEDETETAATDAAEAELEAEPSGQDADEATDQPADDGGGSTSSRRRRRGSRGRGRKSSSGEGNDSEAEPSEPSGQDADETGDQPADDASAEPAPSSRRSRSRRGSKTEPAAQTQTDGPQDEAGTDQGDGDEQGDQQGEGAGTSSSSRRRRRRRRSGESSSATASSDDPPQTVVKVRESRPASDDVVTGVSGSTRLEAKKQRRRDGRDQARRRTPVLTEAEFLARRESVDRHMVVRQTGERTQIAVLEDGVLVEHYVTQTSQHSYVGNVYLGRVQNVLPAMEAAFVDIGKGRNGVLYAGEVAWSRLGLDGKARRIENVLRSGDPVLVQVTKDPVGHKGARLTGMVSLPGRFLVYAPGGSMSGISRKLPEGERNRLKAILKKVFPDEASVIIRTAAEGASEEEITRDVRQLEAQWQEIETNLAGATAPSQLYGEPDLAIKVVRDMFNEDVAGLVVSGDDTYETLRTYVGGVAPDLLERVTRWDQETDVFTAHRVDEQLAKALDRKVFLPSGGSLVIDRTEAMTVVDVNTGKFIGSGGSLEETVTKNNLEAAEEIVRQIRLRDIGGIIVIDFIDMVLERNRDLVQRRLVECLGRDRTRHQVAEVTSLGLVQMTRKRVGQGLLEAFSEPCEHCHGRGVIIHAEPVEQKVRREDADPVGGSKSRGGGSDEPSTKKKSSRSRGKGSKTDAAQAAEVPAIPAGGARNTEVIRAMAAAIRNHHDDGDEPQQATEPDTESIIESATQPITEPIIEPIPESITEAAADERPEPASQPEPDPQPEPEPAAPSRSRRRRVTRPAGAPVTG